LFEIDAFVIIFLKKNKNMTIKINRFEIKARQDDFCGTLVNSIHEYYPILKNTKNLTFDEMFDSVKDMFSLIEWISLIYDGNLEVLKNKYFWPSPTGVSTNPWFNYFYPNAVPTCEIFKKLHQIAPPTDLLNQRFFQCVKDEDVQGMNILYLLGADINARDSSSETPLIASLNQFSYYYGPTNFQLEHGAQISVNEVKQKCKKNQFLPKGAYLLIEKFLESTEQRIYYVAYDILFSNIFTTPDYIFSDLFKDGFIKRKYKDMEASFENNKWVVSPCFIKLIQVLVGYSYTQIMHTASLNDTGLNIIHYLIDNGVDVNDVDSKARTALMVAAEHGCENIVKYLIEKGANVNLQDLDGKTALFSATNGLSVANHLSMKDFIAWPEIDPIYDPKTGWSEGNIKGREAMVAKVKASQVELYSRIVSVLEAHGATIEGIPLDKIDFYHEQQRKTFQCQKFLR
jgi:ankyrin repeat protein